ncbi:DUF2953 domain-containing protein [Clostridium sp.]|jgi:hypothetical protein|uniref:DUF2953 domain-containing protein n=1 Tax=Clostridium sp. TaxID=1506 RepID=UPI0039F4BFAE
MYIFLFLIIIVLFIVFLLYAVPLKILFSVNSAELPDFHFQAFWLRPLLKGVIREEHKKMVLKVYLLNNKIFTKPLQDDNSSKSFLDKINFLRELHPDFEKLEASYGFEDPSITGMVYGGINLLSPYVKSETFYNNADFSMLQDYFYIDTVFYINAVQLIKVLFKYNQKPKMKVLYHSR